jgi:hypothetical protein
MKLILTFRQSTSKNYKEAIGMSKMFEEVSFTELNRVTIQIYEVFEKFEIFANLFWLTVDWKGTTIEYSGMKYHCHSDKTMIFYSLQQSYQNWRDFTSYKLVNTYRTYKGEDTPEAIETEYMTSEQADMIIDNYNLKNKPLNEQS